MSEYIEKQGPDFDLAQDFPVLHAILSRRNTRQFENRTVEKETIHKLLYAASWAPNHKLTEPWRFVVVTPESKSKFIDTYCQGMLSMGLQKDPKAQEDSVFLEKIEKVRKDFSKVPLFIAAASAKHKDPVLGFENRVTTACALQNMLLAAQELGIYAHWGLVKELRPLKYRSF
jgi:nitroreductase